MSFKHVIFSPRNVSLKTKGNLSSSSTDYVRHNAVNQSKFMQQHFNQGIRQFPEKKLVSGIKIKMYLYFIRPTR